MPNYAQVMIIGHIGKAEAFQYGDKNGVKFTIAFSDWRKGKDGNKKPPVWFDVTLFNATDITTAGLVKGAPVFVVARPEMQVWTKDGQENKRLVWVAESVEILRSKNENTPDASVSSSKDKKEASSYGKILDDEIPF